MITPGPWIAVSTDENGNPLIDEWDVHYSFVIPYNGSYPEDILCNVDGANHDHEHNARLIALAPDMLDVIVGLITGMNTGLRPDLLLRPDSPLYAELTALAEKLRMVEGE